MDDPTSPEESTVEYAIAAHGRRRFLTALAAICDTHDVRWEWDLVGAFGMRKVEVVYRGVPDALDAVEREIWAWREGESSYWSGPSSGSGF